MGGPLINQLIGVKIAGVILVQQSPTLLKKQREGKLNYFQFIQFYFYHQSMLKIPIIMKTFNVLSFFLSFSHTHIYTHTHNKLKIYNGYNIETRQFSCVRNLDIFRIILGKNSGQFPVKFIQQQTSNKCR